MAVQKKISREKFRRLKGRTEIALIIYFLTQLHLLGDDHDVAEIPSRGQTAASVRAP